MTHAPLLRQFASRVEIGVTACEAHAIFLSLEIRLC